MAAVMTVYQGRTAIGTIQDFGKGQVLARVVDDNGRYRSLGYHADRKTAMLAVTNAHEAGPQPPEAA
jgi:hypothetical protein